MSGIAALNVPGANETWFFKGSKYARISWKDEQGGDTLVGGPREITSYWASIKATGFPHIDAILPFPSEDDSVYRAYVFHGTKYANIEYKPGDSMISSYTRDITSMWNSLKSAGFSHIDAAIMVPGKTDEAFMFSGGQYCRIKFHVGYADNDLLLDGPKPIDIWSNSGICVSIKKVDTILPYHGSNNKAYLFSGDQYLSFKIGVGSESEFELLGGPKYATGWHSLRQAGFY